MATSNTKRNENKDSEDLYSTPRIALESFYEQYRQVIDQYEVFYDPCDGLGDISDFLKEKGKKVYTSDLVDYGTGAEIANFLEVEKIPEDVDCIIFNPPFKLTSEFVDKALSLCDNLLMFNRMTTIESKIRAKKFKSGEWPLTSMFQFGFRVSCTRGVEREPTANSVAYSWFEFNRKNPTPPTLNWIV